MSYTPDKTIIVLPEFEITPSNEAELSKAIVEALLADVLDELLIPTNTVSEPLESILIRELSISIGELSLQNIDDAEIRLKVRHIVLDHYVKYLNDPKVYDEYVKAFF